MAAVRERLEKLGLGEYVQRFLDERFDTWKTLSDITEQDLCVADDPDLAPQTPLTIRPGRTSTSSSAIAE